MFCLVPLLLFAKPLATLVALARSDDRYTHLPLIPFVCLALILYRRRSIFRGTLGRLTPGLILAAAGIALSGLAQTLAPSPQAALPMIVCGVVLAWVGGFISVYGTGPFKAALFPLTLLLLFIPLPAPVVESAQVMLQQASAEVTYLLFRLVGTPVFRQGFQFSLPGFTIEVARECSGIRSTIALLITALVLSYLFLRSGWRRAAFVLLTVPIAIFKNALRIASMSWLGIYVSKDYLYGDVHRYGGLPVSAAALLLLIPALLLLQRSEQRRPAQSAPATAQPAPSPTK
ncbi:MAG: exosortase/archaeosortase family protein [Paludibaculum sp.]